MVGFFLFLEVSEMSEAERLYFDYEITSIDAERLTLDLDFENPIFVSAN